MKVTVSVGGRFWAFELAQQLLRRDYLNQLITAYPASRAVKYGIPANKIKSLPLKEVIERGWRMAPSVVRRWWNPQFFVSELFDRSAARRLVQSDIIVGWSNFSLHTFRRAKLLGARTVLERANSHMLTQQAILREEYDRWGVTGELAHPAIVTKELQEYELTDYVSVPSSFVKRTFIERGFPAERIIQVPFGVNLSMFTQLPKTDKVFRVVFVGTMSLRKGIPYLLRAFAELKLPNAELCLVGRLLDEVKPFFDQYRGSYRWLGQQPQSELNRFYSQGSVFVLMSVEEGLAMVLAQAMACGLPVICTPNTGGEDIVRDGVDGFIIPLRDTEALKEKLTFLAEHPEVCARMGASARERVSRGFSWDDYGEQMIQAYEKILRK